MLILSIHYKPLQRVLLNLYMKYEICLIRILMHYITAYFRLLETAAKMTPDICFLFQYWKESRSFNQHKRRVNLKIIAEAIKAWYKLNDSCWHCYSERTESFVGLIIYGDMYNNILLKCFPSYFVQWVVRVFQICLRMPTSYFIHLKSDVKWI